MTITLTPKEVLDDTTQIKGFRVAVHGYLYIGETAVIEDMDDSSVVLEIENKAILVKMLESLYPDSSQAIHGSFYEEACLTFKMNGKKIDDRCYGWVYCKGGEN